MGQGARANASREEKAQYLVHKQLASKQLQHIKVVTKLREWQSINSPSPIIQQCEYHAKLMELM